MDWGTICSIDGKEGDNMSTAPSGFQTPKNNWQPADVVQASDLNRIEGNISAIEQGARTLDQAQAPSGNEGSLRQILSWLANRIRAITGTTNWHDSPPTTLTAAKQHIDATGAVHGATTAATANTLALRDAGGRLKAAAPVAADDVVRKQELDALPAAAYAPGDPILAENLTEVYGNWNYQSPQTMRSFVSPVAASGYRITFEGRISNDNEAMLAELFINSTLQGSTIVIDSESYTAVSRDIGPVMPGDVITLRVGQTGTVGSATYYVRNFRVRGVPAPPPFTIT